MHIFLLVLRIDSHTTWNTSAHEVAKGQPPKPSLESRYEVQNTVTNSYLAYILSLEMAWMVVMDFMCGGIPYVV